MRTISKSLKETKDLAQKFLNELKPKKESATVVGLRGNLGSGKTTFVKSIAEILGLQNTVSSPTFVIEKIYKLENQNFSKLIHIDAYRLKSSKDLMDLGFKEIASSSQNLIFIEWPEKVLDVLTSNNLFVDFKFVDDKTREIKW